jgi:hypothetical protein
MKGNKLDISNMNKTIRNEFIASKQNLFSVI